jgi:hypothetical protein
MKNVRENLHKLSLLGGKMLKSIPNIPGTDQQNSSKPNMPPKMEWLCPQVPNMPPKMEWLCPQVEQPIQLHCSECEDFKLFNVIECIENGNLAHRYKCQTCGVILGDEPEK